MEILLLSPSMKTGENCVEMKRDVMIHPCVIVTLCACCAKHFQSLWCRRRRDDLYEASFFCALINQNEMLE